jgi:thiamine pyrophosphokinase
MKYFKMKKAKRKYKWDKMKCFENILGAASAAFLVWGATGYIKVLFTNLP